MSRAEPTHDGRRAPLVTARPAASPTDPRLRFCRYAASLPNQNGGSETACTNYMRVRQQSRSKDARELRPPPAAPNAIFLYNVSLFVAQVSRRLYEHFRARLAVFPSELEA